MALACITDFRCGKIYERKIRSIRPDHVCGSCRSSLEYLGRSSGPVTSQQHAARAAPEDLESLAESLYAQWNRDVFDGRLPRDLRISWRNGMSWSAGMVGAVTRSAARN